MKHVIYRMAAWFAAVFSTPWALFHQQRIQARGRPLTAVEAGVAKGLGVSDINNIFVMEVERVPNPLRWSFGLMEKCGTCVSEVDGITLGHGIYVSCAASNSLKLMAHELVHVGQYERAGSVWSFMIEYIYQCLVIGYHDSAWEVEARAESATALVAMAGD